MPQTGVKVERVVYTSSGNMYIASWIGVCCHSRDREELTSLSSGLSTTRYTLISVLSSRWFSEVNISPHSQRYKRERSISLLLKISLPCVLESRAEFGNVFIIRTKLACTIKAIPSNQFIVSSNHCRVVKGPRYNSMQSFVSGQVRTVDRSYGMMIP